MIAVRRIAAAAALAALAGISAPSAFAAARAADDAPFLKAIHQGNLTEIQDGENAGKHARATCVKTVGATLVRDHKKLDADVKALANKLGVTLPTSPSAAQEQALAAVQAKAGTSGYDSAWLANEDKGHVATLELIDQEIATGGNSEVRAAASAARPVVAEHLTLIRDCKAELNST
ncbi:DUF4142 domain-containing protein [Streptomyces sp. NPDC059479]|uniref:DUF4142 domain-containing protein n=1 Tax=Streptomyces sp. NPDC059479 TaxID=3346848 RepID=UPI0036A99481